LHATFQRSIAAEAQLPLAAAKDEYGAELGA
jgi:DNA-binding transcriptional regulator YbjK